MTHNGGENVTMNFAALSLFTMRGTLQLDLAAFTPYLLITSPPLHYSSPLGSTTPYLCSWCVLVCVWDSAQLGQFLHVARCISHTNTCSRAQRETHVC